MLIVFIFLMLILVYIFFGYPLILFILASLLGKRIDKKDFYPYVSLVISAYNEENVIKQKIENSLNLDYPREKLEIIVASEAKDGTNEIIQRYANYGIKLCAFEGREGKAVTLFRVVPQTKGEIIIFSDANSLYSKDAIKKLVRNFSDKRVGCVSGRLTYNNPKDSVVGQNEIVYWNYEIALKKLSSRLSAFTGGAHGAIFALRRQAYHPLSKYRGDDFELAVNAAIHGYRVVFEPEAVAYEEASETFQQEFERKVRIVSWNFQSALLLFKEALKHKRLFVAFQLLSHKILRWCVPFFLVSLFISSMVLSIHGGLGYVVFFTAQVIFYLTALLLYMIDRSSHWVAPKFLSLPYYFCMVNYAAAKGVLKSLFSTPEVVWEKAR